MKKYSNLLIGTVSEYANAVNSNEANKSNTNPNIYLWLKKNGYYINLIQVFEEPQEDTTHLIGGYYVSLPTGYDCEFAFIDAIKEVSDVEVIRYSK